MQVVFRVDSSHVIGTGHVMRCITLAKKIARDPQVRCLFICREHLGNIAFVIEDAGFTVGFLKSKPSIKQHPLYSNWLGSTQKDDALQTFALLNALKIKRIALLVVDNYALDITWEAQFKKSVKQLLVIDDLADRKHQCDALLDQNMAPSYRTRYQHLLPKGCQTFLGSHYSLLRDDFYICRNKVQVRTQLRRLFIFFGGVDKQNMTLKCLQKISVQLPLLQEIQVVVGRANRHKKSVQDFCNQHKNCIYHEQISNMAELMLNSDLAIGAGGTTNAERMFLGLPSLVFSIADNQYIISQYLGNLGWIDFMGSMQNSTLDKLPSTLWRYLLNPVLIERKSAQLLADNMNNMDDFIKQIWPFYT